MVNKVVVAGWLGWFSVFAVRFAPSPVLVLIEKSFGASHSDASLIFTSHLLGYAIMQITAGIMSDILGPLRVIIAGLIAMSLSCIAIGFSPNISTMVILAFIAGLGAGTFYTSSTSLISTLFSPSERGKALGLVYSGIGAGASASIIIGGLLGNMGLWKEIFYIISIPGLIASLIFMTIKPNPVGKSDSIQYQSNIWSLMFQVLRERSIAIYNIVHALLLLTYFAVASFMPTYIVSTIESSILYANLVSLSLSIPDIFGGFIGGYLIGVFGARNMIYISFLSIAATNLIIPYLKPSTYVVFLLPVIGFMSRAAATALPILVIESTPKGIVGSILGWYNSIGFVGGSTGPYLFGVIADTAGFTLSFNTISIFPIISIILLYISHPRSSYLKYKYY